MLSSSQLGGPFDFCAFASLSELLLGSLVIALKCTRPRQRFMYVIGRYSMTEGGMCQGIFKNKISFLLSLFLIKQLKIKMQLIQWSHHANISFHT